MKEHARPIIIRGEDGTEFDGQVYTLQFSRETVEWAEKRKGFKISEVTEFPLTGVRNLFQYSFRMHHTGMTPSQLDTIFDSLKTDRSKLIERLVELYLEVLEATTADTNASKNAGLTVEM